MNIRAINAFILFVLKNTNNANQSVDLRYLYYSKYSNDFTHTKAKVTLSFCAVSATTVLVCVAKPLSSTLTVAFSGGVNL